MVGLADGGWSTLVIKIQTIVLTGKNQLEIMADGLEYDSALFILLKQQAESKKPGRVPRRRYDFSFGVQNGGTREPGVGCQFKAFDMKAVRVSHDS